MAELTLADGRLLAYQVMGAPAGRPMLVLHGTLDRNVPVAHARVIATRCPTAGLHLVDGGGHMLFSQLDDILASVQPRPA